MEPTLSLAFTMNANKGAYALLLGSGVSRSAQIPTGWEVTIGLVEQLAHLASEDVGSDPIAWYVERYGKQPDYSELLDSLAATPTERHQLLKGYFEPDEEEREQGLKRPTPAHRAIARLMKDGFIRVVVTTNFDRLLEDALAEEGAPRPTVIATADAMDGALPLSHPGSFIIKVHGDYLDTRIKNTVAELSAYDPRMDALLDRVLDEFGLITCGWSAEWDIALKRVFERCKGRRFGTYWTYIPPLNTAAQDLIALRGATAIAVKGADAFFVDLDEKVRALAESSRPHPLSIQAAISTVKRYIVDEQQRIRLNDLFSQETEGLYDLLSLEKFPMTNVPTAPDAFVDRLKRYDVATDRLASMLLQGIYWGGPQHHRIWIRTLERIANPPSSGGGLTTYLKLQGYPAFRLLVAAGVAAVAAGNLDAFWTLFTKARVLDYRGQEAPIVEKINFSSVLEDRSLLTPLFGGQERIAPLGDYLGASLRPLFRELLPRNEEYELLFDKFEYLMMLTYASVYDEIHVPLGRLLSNWGRASQYGAVKQINDEIELHGESWPLLRAGLFGGSLSRLKEKKEVMDDRIGRRFEKATFW